MGHERALRGCPPANKTAALLFKPEGEGYPLKRVWPAHARPVCKIKGWSPTNDVDLKHTRGTSPGPTVEQVEWESAVAPLSRGSRQRDLKNDVSLPPITPRVVAGPSLIETSPVSVWKTIYPRVVGKAIKHVYVSGGKISLIDTGITGKIPPGNFYQCIKCSSFDR